MADYAIKAGTKFPTELVAEMFDAVQGHSALAKLSPETPMPFNGVTEMVFSDSGEAQLVAEGGAKAGAQGTVAPKVIKPQKFVYQQRVSDEFMKAGDEGRLQYLRGFAEGFAKKIARGFDIAAIHGLEPSTLTDASFKSTNSFDGLVTNIETYNASTIDTNIEDAIADITGTATGIALSKDAGAALGSLKANGVPQFPEFRFGQNPDAFYGMASDVNSTINVAKAGAAAEDKILVGNFEAFKWGYADNIPLEVIRYGDPDGAGRDLKQYNEVCLRAEAYIGWGILDADAFALVQGAVTSA